LGDPSEQNKGVIVPSLPSVRVVGHDGGNVVELDRVGLGLCGAGAGTGEVAAGAGAEIQEVLQREHLALPGRQRTDGGEQRPAVLVRQHRSLSGLDQDRRLRTQPQGNQVSAAARPAAINHGGTQVGQDVSRILDLVPVPVQTEERVLHHVFGRGAVPGEQEREPHQPERVLPVQILDPRLRSRPHAPMTRESAK
jgi:hypothetical protein